MTNDMFLSTKRWSQPGGVSLVWFVVSPADNHSIRPIGQFPNCLDLPQQVYERLWCVLSCKFILLFHFIYLFYFILFYLSIYLFIFLFIYFLFIYLFNNRLYSVMSEKYFYETKPLWLPDIDWSQTDCSLDRCSILDCGSTHSHVNILCYFKNDNHFLLFWKNYL